MLRSLLYICNYEVNKTLNLFLLRYNIHDLNLTVALLGWKFIFEKTLYCSSKKPYWASGRGAEPLGSSEELADLTSSYTRVVAKQSWLLFSRLKYSSEALLFKICITIRVLLFIV